ncbi:PREDICTED: metal transporter CNNM4 isoform X2 [Nicrophorus vespilloides]|uniref:Metal transporter CNNM4 isoform X2 n=1 Tax=Nicrophorus vespilloides TaxID=110193 RepID=A0ABM1NFU1_NICVS|nr:PREDICTED: metal transporter CNNM4 isoform X2 [Nicrophorus vespilloides]
MASRSPRQKVRFVLALASIATVLLQSARTVHAHDQAVFDSLRLIRTGAAEEDNLEGSRKVWFEVAGRGLYQGIGNNILVTDAKELKGSECAVSKDRLIQTNLTEIVVEHNSARFAMVIPLSVEGEVYFCLPRSAVNDDEIISPAGWYHQGTTVAILLNSTDLGPVQKHSRDVEQMENLLSKVKVHGVRVDVAPKEPHLDEYGVPYLLAGSTYTLRLFGRGFSEHTLITFTQYKGNYGDSCQIPATGVFEIVNGSLQQDSVQVVMRLPPAEQDGPFYICVREGTAKLVERVTDSRPFVHQGSEPWIRVKSFEKMVPIWAAITIICVCLCFSALFSGLNLGLMSLDRTELKILCNTGTNKEQQYAKKIQPVRNHGNYLLCSILLGNVLVNSTFTILLDDLTSGVIAVISSTLAIVMFGEITPQAICSRHGLAIGAKTIVITKLVMAVTFPLSYPISKILDVLLGEEIGSVYTRERLKELVKVTTGENDLDRDEVNIISGALELRKKAVAEVMTKIEDAFMLDYEAILNFETVSEIMKSGYSRIPVFENDRKNIVTTLYIKDLAFVDPDDNTPLKTLSQFYQNPCNFVFEDVTLDVMFKDFKEGNKGHMAFVNRVNNEGEGDPFYETIGLITLEDVIEELIQAEIMDETDVFTDNRSKRRRADRTKQDFTVFAERRGENNRIRISPQLTLAAFQYLSTSVELFKTNTISETILRRLLKQDIINHVKKTKDWRNDPLAVIYQQGKPADYFVLILEGRVEVTVGTENLMFESGAFTYFGTQALIQNVGVVESPSTLGSLQSLNMDSMLRFTFQPDYTVRACSEVLYMKVKRNLYMAAKRASLMERSQRDNTTASTDQFDDEVEKLLHSLEEDGSIGTNSPEPKKRLSVHEVLVNMSQNASPKTPSVKSHLSPTVMRSFGSGGIHELNGSVKPNPMDEILSREEEKHQLLPRKS